MQPMHEYMDTLGARSLGASPQTVAARGTCVSITSGDMNAHPTTIPELARVVQDFRAVRLYDAKGGQRRGT